jgi:hypothetical protein
MLKMEKLFPNIGNDLQIIDVPKDISNLMGSTSTYLRTIFDLEGITLESLEILDKVKNEKGNQWETIRCLRAQLPDELSSDVVRIRTAFEKMLERKRLIMDKAMKAEPWAKSGITKLTKPINDLKKVLINFDMQSNDYPELFESLDLTLKVMTDAVVAKRQLAANEFDFVKEILKDNSVLFNAANEKAAKQYNAKMITHQIIGHIEALNVLHLIEQNKTQQLPIEPIASSTPSSESLNNSTPTFHRTITEALDPAQDTSQILGGVQNFIEATIMKTFEEKMILFNQNNKTNQPPSKKGKTKGKQQQHQTFEHQHQREKHFSNTHLKTTPYKRTYTDMPSNDPPNMRPHNSRYYETDTRNYNRGTDMLVTPTKVMRNSLETGRNLNQLQNLDRSRQETRLVYNKYTNAPRRRGPNHD